MSLAIETDRVDAVLLIDGWHRVHLRSFDTDSFELLWRHPDPEREDRFENYERYGVCAVGFRFLEEVRAYGATTIEEVMGPLTSVLALRYEDVGA